MTFRGRLRLFFTIIVIVPLVVIGLVLFSLTGDSERGKVDAALGTGLRVALADYAEARRAAEPALERVAKDPQLTRALVREDEGAIVRRLDELTAPGRGVAGARLADLEGDLSARAGARDAFAFAGANLSNRSGGGLGTLAVSVTRAPALLAGLARGTGLDYVAIGGGRPLAGTAPGVLEVPVGSAELEAGGRDYRARRGTVGEVAGRREEIAVLSEAADLNAAISDKRFLVAAILVAFLLLALGFSVYVTRSLSGEIARFLAAARRLAGGRFDEPVPTHGSDEFAQLGQEFNSMSEQLAAKIEEVERKRRELEETIRRVGRAFATGLDRQGIVELAVQTAVDACDAACGRALSLDPDIIDEVRAGTQEHGLAAALEAAERAAFAVRPELGAELLEGPEARGIPRELDVPTPASDGSAHALAIPLRARLGRRSVPTYVGVVSIARRERRFDAEEAELLRYLAGQAVISIENVDLHELVQQQAVTDELTGLANLREMHAALDRELERRRRLERPVGFVLFDLDDFKRINDTYGHQQGDEVLIAVADVLRDRERATDLPARYGGEEFAVVLPETHLAGGGELAEDLREKVAGLRIPLLDGGELRITASFGVAAVPDSSADKASLIAAADAALYEAKRAGKNRVVPAAPAVAER